MVLTKQTKIVYEPGFDSDYLSSYLMPQRPNNEGKTDFVIAQPDANTFIRKWIDQEAAEAWINTVRTAATRAEATILSAEISDIDPDWSNWPQHTVPQWPINWSPPGYTPI